MKKILFIGLVFILFLLAACGGQTVTSTVPPAEPTTVPTEAPPAEPTTAPTDEVTEAAGDEIGVPPPAEEIVALWANPWQWESFTNPVEQFDVENPENYVVVFNDDGSVNIKADCNNANGSVVVDSSSLTINIGPMTLVACSPESRSDAFVQYLSAAAIYFFEDGKLYIDLMADGGTMSFAPAEAASDAATDSGLSADLVAQLDEFLQAQIYSEGSNPISAAPGVVLLVDTPDGRYLQAAGVSSLEDGTSMQVDDRLEIGSNSKSFTIVLLMQLQEEGLLSLDDPLSKWLPDQAAAIPNGDQMTLRQLAQHTSGVWDYGDPIIGEAANNPDKLEDGYAPEELVQYAIDNGTPDFAPGEEGKWKYSNTGYVLLGLVIEEAAGKSLGENTTNWNTSQGWAAGSIAMTAEDLLAYAQGLSAGDLFQDPDSLAQMLTFDPNGMLPYGLGLMDFSGAAPGFWGHEGQTAGFQSLWYTNPETEITVVGLSNSANYSGFSFIQIAPMLISDPNEETAVEPTEESATEPATLPDDWKAQLDAFLQSQVYSEGGNPAMAAPGLVLLVDTPDGRYLQAAGVSNMEDGTAMLVDDRLEIGSNSKSMTVVLLMQLVENGVLSLDDPLSKWLPEQAASLPNGDQMTVRQLASTSIGASHHRCLGLWRRYHWRRYSRSGQTSSGVYPRRTRAIRD